MPYKINAHLCAGLLTGGDRGPEADAFHVRCMRGLGFRTIPVETVGKAVAREVASQSNGEAGSQTPGSVTILEHDKLASGGA